MRRALDEGILAWMREPGWRPDEARFARLARALFAHQFAHCAPYRRFCEDRGRTPDTLGSWREIPALPTGAFKELALRSFPAERERHCFRNSGTSTARRGKLHLDTLALYEASLLASFRRHVLPELETDPHAKLPLLVLAPSPGEAPDSSLSHMFGVALRELGSAGSDFFVRDAALETPRLEAALRDAEARGDAVALCGTAFAFVHLLEALAARGVALRLPEGSRVMETGGFKGRSRARSGESLRAAIDARLGIPPGRCVNQYGMTELGSQFYDSVLRHPGEPRRKLEPPWTRVAILDPESGEELPEGAAGVIAIYDLANTGSVFSVQTADVGRRIAGGLEIAGRDPGAEARGCSIAADTMLGGARA